MADESGTGKVERLLSMYKHLEPVPTAVAHPCEASALSGAIEAAHQDSLCPSWSARAQRSRPPPDPHRWPSRRASSGAI